MKLEIPTFKNISERNKFLIENKDTLITQKKAEMKRADGFTSQTTVMVEGEFEVLKGTDAYVVKAETNENELKVRVIINTTNIMDSHKDVHIPGIWSKSLKENKRMMHVQEHKSNEFNKIISSGDDLKASAKTYSWKDLGLDAEGDTQALVFDSVVKRSRNPYMHEQYKNGYVDNHSVGMRYVKVELAVNDDEYEKELDYWKKYIDQIVNRKDAEDMGYFWVVTEAKIIEGSAVPSGSNPITPTISSSKGIVEDKEYTAIKEWLKS